MSGGAADKCSKERKNKGQLEENRWDPIEFKMPERHCHYGKERGWGTTSKRNVRYGEFFHALAGFATPAGQRIGVGTTYL